MVAEKEQEEIERAIQLSMMESNPSEIITIGMILLFGDNT